MKKSTITLIAFVLSSLLFAACNKAPRGVIPESDMAHVIADFAKAEELIEQNPEMFYEDSTRLALKQSILKKYGADLAMYDTSLVWYAHNLKLYTELHDKAIEILEKEGNIKHGSTNNQIAEGSSQQQANYERRVFPSTGDSANIWKEPQQWVLTSAMHKGYITYDYKPDPESRNGDKFSLFMKMLNTSGNSIKLLLAIDYTDGATSYINRTANINGWSNFDIQSDSTRNIKRIYGYLYYDIKPHNVTFIDSIYMLRTHLDPTSYGIINIQRIAGPKAVLEKNTNEQLAPIDINNKPLPGMPRDIASSAAGPSSRLIPPADKPSPTIRRGDSTLRSKPSFNKSSIPSRDQMSNPNGAHVPKPPIR